MMKPEIMKALEEMPKNFFEDMLLGTKRRTLWDTLYTEGGRDAVIRAIDSADFMESDREYMKGFAAFYATMNATIERYKQDRPVDVEFLEGIGMTVLTADTADDIDKWPPFASLFPQTAKGG